MSDKKIRKYVLAALFAALTCVATMIIRIPTPGTSGYIHPGDAIVILSGALLGPAAGFLAAGIGSALSDLIGGYMLYVPVTFFVKGSVALITGFIFMKLGTSKKKKYLSVVFGGIADMVLVVFGYGIFETILYGLPGAIASAGPNLIQGAAGLVLALVLYPLLSTVTKQE
jgi:uncharacterized membrane protein